MHSYGLAHGFAIYLIIFSENNIADCASISNNITSIFIITIVLKIVYKNKILKIQYMKRHVYESQSLGKANILLVLEIL